MTGTGISERILQGVRENSADSTPVREFIEELIRLEVERPGWWKDTYKKAVAKYSKDWEVNHED